MLKEIDSQARGGLRARLMKVTFSDSGIMNAKQFTVLINDQLNLSTNDQGKLQRVAGFASLKKDAALKIEIVQKNIEDRVEKSAKMRDDCIKKIVK